MHPQIIECQSWKFKLQNNLKVTRNRHENSSWATIPGGGKENFQEYFCLFGTKLARLRNGGNFG